MPKENISASIDTETIDKIKELASPEKYDRSFSKMLDIVLQKGLDAIAKEESDNSTTGNTKHKK